MENIGNKKWLAIYINGVWKGTYIPILSTLKIEAEPKSGHIKIYFQQINNSRPNDEYTYEGKGITYYLGTEFRNS